MFEVGIQMALIGPSSGEFVVVMIVLLLLFGAKDAPRIMRTLHEFVARLRQTAESFKREVMYGDFDEKDHSALFGPQRRREPPAPEEAASEPGASLPATSQPPAREDDDDVAKD